MIIPNPKIKLSAEELKSTIKMVSFGDNVVICLSGISWISALFINEFTSFNLCKAP